MLQLLRNRFFWLGLGGLALVLVVVALFFNGLLLPNYTRHGVSVTVPDVTRMSFEEAEAVLAAADLRVERREQRYNANFPRDVVIEQLPAQNATVKPGRRIFLTVNSGTVPMVVVPNVSDLSLRDAQLRVRSVGLQVGETRPDTIPSPYRNTVTRQQPAAGDSLREGASVTLWYSTGLGEETVVIPDVTGMTVAQAQAVLLEQKLRSVIVARGEDEDLPVDERTVTAQGPEAGTQVREGAEIRLFTASSVDEEDPSFAP